MYRCDESSKLSGVLVRAAFFLIHSSVCSSHARIIVSLEIRERHAELAARVGAVNAALHGVRGARGGRHRDVESDDVTETLPLEEQFAAPLLEHVGLSLGRRSRDVG